MKTHRYKIVIYTYVMTAGRIPPMVSKDILYPKLKSLGVAVQSRLHVSVVGSQEYL